MLVCAKGTRYEDIQRRALKSPHMAKRPTIWSVNQMECPDSKVSPRKLLRTTHIYYPKGNECSMAKKCLGGTMMQKLNFHQQQQPLLAIFSRRMLPRLVALPTRLRTTLRSSYYAVNRRSSSIQLYQAQSFFSWEKSFSISTPPQKNPRASFLGEDSRRNLLLLLRGGEIVMIIDDDDPA